MATTRQDLAEDTERANVVRRPDVDGGSAGESPDIQALLLLQQQAGNQAVGEYLLDLDESSERDYEFGRDGVSISSTDTSGSTLEGEGLRSTDSTSTTRKLGVSDGDLSYSTSTVDRSGSDDNSSTSTTTTTVGTGGYSRTTATTEQVGDYTIGNSQTTAVTRGDGKLGYSSTTGSTVGGTSTSRTVGGGVIAGEDGYGGYGTAGGSATRTLAKGVKVGVSSGLDGRFTVNVTQVPGSLPPQYQLVLTISLGAKLGTSGSAERGALSGSLSGSASGSITATFKHLMSEPDAAGYLADLDRVGAAPPSGMHRELQILRAAVVDGDDAAKAMLTAGQAALAGDPASAAQLSEGDSLSLKVEGRVGASGSAGAKGDGAGAGLSGGVTAGASMTWVVARKGGKVVLTGTPASETGWNASGSASFDAATLSYGEDHRSTASRTFTFALDPDSPDYASLYGQITGATDTDSLAAIAAAHPELVTGRSTTTGTGETDTTSAGLGPLSMSMKDSSGRTTTTALDPTGAVTTTETGTGSSGLSVSGAGVPLASYTESEELTTTVAPDNTATGDVSSTTSSSDLGATWDEILEHPLDSLAGLVTGGTKLAEKSDVAGMKLSDGDYQTIAAMAGDPRGWDRAGVPLSVTQDLADWHACRSRILAAGGDRTAIAKALADFVSGAGSRRAQAIQLVVRGAGSAEGGTRYEWPSELKAQQSVYQALVDDDPVSAITKLRQAGRNDQAAKLARDDLSRLDALLAELQANRDKFTDGASYGEMLRTIAERRGDLTRATAPIAARMPAPDEFTVPTLEQAQQQDAERNAAKAEYDGLVQSLAGFLAVQTRIFGEVQAEQAKQDNWFSKPDVYVIAAKLTELKNRVYPEWDAAFEAAKAAAARAGLPAPAQPVPARGWWDHLNTITFSDY
jgi:hypothetical protein